VKISALTMTLAPRWLSLCVALLPLAVPGCATGPTRAGASPVNAPRPLSVAVTLVAGDVEARGPDEGSFVSLGAGGGAAGKVIELRAARGGSVVLGSAGDPRAKLWLRGGSNVQLAEDERGRIVVGVTRGEARARVYDDPKKLVVGTGNEAREAPQGDVLVRSEEGIERMVPTSEDPGAAAFALEVESQRPQAAAGVGSLEVRTADDKTAHLARCATRRCSSGSTGAPSSCASSPSSRRATSAS
jgi:hypothetical protein